MTVKIVVLFLFSIACLSFTVNDSSVTPVKTDFKDMVMVRGGVYQMGIDSTRLKADITRFNQPAAFFSQEFPSIRVNVIPFYLDKYEVTNADFKKFIDANPQWGKTNIPDSLQDGNYLKEWKGDKYPKGQGDYPVVYVCFYAANAYANWRGKRLPTEAEFEYAAKGGANGAVEFPWGNADAGPEKANYLNPAVGHPVKVGSYAPNSLEIYDLAGNVSEFCMDRWLPNRYAEFAEFVKSRKLIHRSDPNRVAVRGGSWNDPAVKLRTTFRESCGITSCTAFTGFRCAASIPRSGR